MKTFNPKLTWQSVKNMHGEDFQYGDSRRHLPLTPAIYRWILKNRQGNIKEIYIGETATLRNRISRHTIVDPRGRREHFDEWRETRGRAIYLETLEIKPFQINNRHYSARSLRDEYKRQLIESIMLYKALDQGYKIRNKGYE